MTNKKILIVENDHDVRMEYRILLKAGHYDTFFAADWLGCLSEAHKHLPDLIVLDLELLGADAILVIEWLKTNNSLAWIPIVVVSAGDPRFDKKRVLEAGAGGFLQKPVNNGRLLTVIRQLLEEPIGPASRFTSHEPDAHSGSRRLA